MTLLAIFNEKNINLIDFIKKSNVNVFSLKNFIKIIIFIVLIFY